MTKKYFVLGCLALQCLTVMAMNKAPENKLRQSTDKLRSSSQELSRSQELAAQANRALAGCLYLTVCGNSKIDTAVNKLEIKPLSDCFYCDCP